MFSRYLSPFPLYLHAPTPFHRRRSSTETRSSDVSIASSSFRPAATAPPNYLGGNSSHFRCARCLTDLCLTSQIISKSFTGRHGRAYLVAPQNPPQGIISSDRDGNLPNTCTHTPVARQLVTGTHTVCDISCAICRTVLGWKYVSAEEDDQKYKIGNFILEAKRVCRCVCWESPGHVVFLSVPSTCPVSTLASPNPSYGSENIEFDSQDEDECEDLFAGVWCPSLAKKRRRSRAWRKHSAGSDSMEEA